MNKSFARISSFSIRWFQKHNQFEADGLQRINSFAVFYGKECGEALSVPEVFSSSKLSSLLSRKSKRNVLKLSSVEISFRMF